MILTVAIIFGVIAFILLIMFILGKISKKNDGQLAMVLAMFFILCAGISYGLYSAHIGNDI